MSWGETSILLLEGMWPWRRAVNVADSAEERRRQTRISTLVHLCCKSFCVAYFPKEEIPAPASFDRINDSVGNILLALVLLGEAKGSKTLDLNKSFSSKLISPESPRVCSVFSERRKARRYSCCSFLPNPLNEIFRRWSGDAQELATDFDEKSGRAESMVVLVHNQWYILRFFLCR